VSLSVVSIFHNEAARTPAWCDQARSIGDEAVVVDQASTDDTVALLHRHLHVPVEIGRPFNIRVIHDKCHGYCEASGTFAMSSATSDWLLLLYADETLTQEFLAKLPECMQIAAVDCFELRRDNFIGGKQWGQHEFTPRLFRRDAWEWPNKLHCDPICTTGRKARLPFGIMHSKTDEEQAADNQRYAQLGTKVGRTDVAAD
jgi:hypothetical protein